MDADAEIADGAGPVKGWKVDIELQFVTLLLAAGRASRKLLVLAHGNGSGELGQIAVDVWPELSYQVSRLA